MALPFLLFEVVALRVHAAHEDGDDDLELAQVVKQAIQTCELQSSPSDKQVLYATERIIAAYQETPDGEERQAPGKRGFASDFVEWLNKLDAQAMCLYAADADVERARYLYGSVDRETVIAVCEHRVAADWKQAQLMFEACLFGFGGSYGEGGGDTETFDLTGDQPDLDALKTMGF